MSEDEKRAWNRALQKVHKMIYDKWPVNSFGEQNKKASDLQDDIMKLMEPTKEGERIFKNGN